MKRMTRSTFSIGLLLTTLLLSLTTHAEAKKNTHWQQTLQLSAEQKQQMEQIEQRHRAAMQQLRERSQKDKAKGERASKEHDSKVHRRDERRELMQQRQQAITELLTPEQQQLAQAFMQERAQRMQARQLTHLAQRLQLSEGQQQQLQQEQQALMAHYQWPMTPEQYQEIQHAWQHILSGMLTEEQMTQWQASRRAHQRHGWSAAHDYQHHKRKSQGDAGNQSQ